MLDRQAKTSSKNENYFEYDFSRVITALNEIKSKDDIFDITCDISYLLQDLDKDELEDVFVYKHDKKESAYIELLRNTLNNEYFNECLFGVMKYEHDEILKLKNVQAVEIKNLVVTDTDSRNKDLNTKHYQELKSLRKKFREKNLDQKKVINLALHTSFLIISFSETYLLEINIKHIVSQLNSIIRNILSFQNYQFDKMDVLDSLSNISFDGKNMHNKEFPSHLQGKLKNDVLFNHLRISRDLVGLILMLISEQGRFPKAFKRMSVSIKKDEECKFLNDIEKLSRNIIFVESSIEKYKQNYRTIFDDSFFDDFLEKARRDLDKNILFVLREMILPFKREEDVSNDTRILEFIANSERTNSKISEYFRGNFSAFSGGDSKGNDWSNKLFLVTIGALSVIKEIKSAKDTRWKIGVFLHEYTSWVEKVNQILNKHNLEDDWDELKKYLIQENTIIEWKSTFYTPTEQVYDNEEAERHISKKIFENVAKPLLGMLNTNGGTILVGIIENPSAIKREDVKRNMISRDGYSLFDLNYEFDKKHKDIDIIKREIQDYLFTKTGYTAEKFNNLWEVTLLQVKDDYNEVTVAKISVKKSKEFIYGKDEMNGKKIMSLTKRADARTIDVDLDDYLIKSDLLNNHSEDADVD